MSHGRYRELLAKMPHLFLNECVVCENEFVDVKQINYCHRCRKMEVRTCRRCGQRYLLSKDVEETDRHIYECHECRKGIHLWVSKNTRVYKARFRQAPMRSSEDPHFENIVRAYEDECDVWQQATEGKDPQRQL